MRSALALMLFVAACAHHTTPAAPAARAPAPSRKPEAGGRKPVLSPDLVLSTIRASYLPGMQRCYRRYLKHNDRAHGRVLLAFTVDGRGRAREASASGVADQVDDCIVAQLQRWTFPAPAHGRDARFALGLDLVAD